MINCAPVYIRWTVENLAGLMKSAILVCILRAPTNSSAQLTRPNGPFKAFTEQQIVSLPKMVDWLRRRSWSSC